MENTSKPQDSNHQSVGNIESKIVREKGDLVYADGSLFVYQHDDRLYVMEPPDELNESVSKAIDHHYECVGNLEKEAYRRVEKGHGEPGLEPTFGGDTCQEEDAKAPVSDVFDPAVVMHAIHEMAYSLRECRDLLAIQLVDRPFTLAEHEAVNEARDLLESYCKDFGVDMNLPSLKLSPAGTPYLG